MKWLLFGVICVALLSAGMVAYYQLPIRSHDKPVACTAEAKICPDGTAVGRTGPNCEFAECPKPPEPQGPTLPSDVKGHIEAHADRIVLDSPKPLTVITSPLTVTGEARGTWYFEASFPVMLVDWDGRIIAEGHADAESGWMTEDFVPFSATLEFTKPEDDARGTLILQKDNPSGLPENDDALEIPILYDEELYSI